MKKFLLVVVVLIICYLSNTPELRVIEPATWFNAPKYEDNVSNLNFVRETSDVFYTAYSKEDLAQTDFVLHKLSHVLFYALFAYLLYLNVRIKKLKYMITWIVVTIFAITDEIHQYFVVGRSGRLYDIFLDSSSAFLILLLVYSFRTFKKRDKTQIETPLNSTYNQ